MDLSVVKAQGVLAAFIATLFQRAGITTVAEFGRTLSLLAATSDPANSEEAEILTLWAAMTLDAIGEDER